MTTSINITKWPVVIFASPRTGSTALGYDISQSYSEIKYYNEPNFRPNELQEFIEYSKTNTNYVLKLLGSSIPMFPEEVRTKIFSDDVFKIKIVRKNIIEQIASHTIGLSRKTWNYINVDEVYRKLENTNIKITFNEIKRSIEMIKYDIDIINKIKTDIVVYYEDLNEFNSITQKTPRPANYNELINAISKLYSSGINQP